MNIKNKILIPMVTLTIGCCAAVLISSILLYSRDLNSAMQEKIIVASTVVENEILALKNKAYIAAMGMADNPDLRDALIKNDREKMAATAFFLQTMAQLDYCTIVDAHGIVLTRTHEPDNFGDSLARLSHVRSALDGETDVFFIPGVTIRLGASAGTPIYDHGMNVIGAISLGYRLDNQDLATRLKEITNCQTSFFLFDERVSTTLLMEDGTFALGTTADKEVSDIVLKGESFIGKKHILGKEALLKYSPIYGAGDNVIGMTCVGYYTEGDTIKKLLFIAAGIVITLVVLIVSIFLARFISRVIESRLETMMSEIRAADEYTQILLDAMPVSCTLWDKSLNIINCNQEAVKLYGVKNREELNKRFFELSPDFQPNGKKSRDAVQTLLRTAFEEGFVRTEWLHQFFDGESLPCEVTLVRVRHKNGFFVAGYSRDLREHKASLAEIEKAQESLRFARDAAETANRAKTIFLAKMSHEIRTPMNSIIGFSELAKDGILPVKTKEYLSSISESAEWLLQIINDILDISKIESGKMELENIPFNLHDIFSYCQSVIMPKAIEKGITLYCYAEPSIGKKLLGDPVKLRQAVINLLTNAVKFTNIGTVKLLASVKKADEKKVTIHFEVKDSGIGMTIQQIERIFEPFIQADDSIKRKYGGTGLGLSITRNFVEMMGGRLNVESVSGVGSKFGFELEFEVISDISDIPIHKFEYNNLEKPNFHGEVLICEDNVMNQRVICEHLGKVGLKTVVAENGKEGVLTVAKRAQKGEAPFDLIFMDIHMPVMDGLEAAAKIRDMDIKTPIVAITANIMSNDLELYKSSGMSGFIGKPFTSQELWKCLLKFFTPISYTEIDKHLQEEEDEKLKKILQLNFAKEYRNKYSEIIKAATDGDIKLAHRLTHTLKTNAGQIEEKRLQELAETVEKIFIDGKNIPAEELQGDGLCIKLEDELKSVIERLEPLLAQAEAASKSRKPSTESPQLFLDRLEAMLINRNPLSIKMTDGLQDIKGTEELIQHIEDYEFKKALDVLLKLKDR